MEDDEEEELSEYEDRTFIDSESDNKFEEEDEVDHQTASEEPVSNHRTDRPVASGNKEQARKKPAMCLDPSWTGRHLYMHHEQEKHMQNTHNEILSLAPHVSYRLACVQCG